ncbi:hypothetical protein [Streptomyces spinosirectus]
MAADWQDISVPRDRIWSSVPGELVNKIAIPELWGLWTPARHSEAQMNGGTHHPHGHATTDPEESRLGLGDERLGGGKVGGSASATPERREDVDVVQPD